MKKCNQFWRKITQTVVLNFECKGLTEEAGKVLEYFLELLVAITAGISVYGIVKIVEWLPKRKPKTGGK